MFAAPQNRQFAQYVAAQRAERRLSLQQFADLVGVTKSTIAYWEAGRVVPQVTTLERLARALGVSYEELHVLAGYSYLKGSEPEQYLRARYPRITERELAKARLLFAELDAATAKRTKRSRERKAVR